MFTCCMTEIVVSGELEGKSVPSISNGVNELADLVVGGGQKALRRRR